MQQSESKPQTAPLAPIEDSDGVPQAIVPGIWRIPLPLPFSLRWVNVYVLHGDGQWCLIDTGLGTRSSLAALHAGLAAIGITLADISTLVLTHGHPDHTAASGDIFPAMGDARQVFLLDQEIESMYAVWGRQHIEDFADLTQFHLLAGLTPQEAEEGTTDMFQMSRGAHLPPPMAITPVTDGATLHLGGRAWQIIWTPGHAPGHMCLVSDNLIITGDHILPTISPNISVHPNLPPDPLHDYLASLARIAALEIAAPLVLPGHGKPFSHLAERIARLQAGHSRRVDATKNALHALGEPARVVDIAKLLFRRAQLERDERPLIIGETLAHLEYLRGLGDVQRGEQDRVWCYSLSAPLLKLS